MSAQAKTIAVVGSTPFAWVLAGLLAIDHSRAIVLVSDPYDPYRLARPPSLSVAPITRPETWARLAETAISSARRLSRIAPGFARRTDVVFGARSPAACIALSHMHHMMAGFGHAVEPTQAPQGGAAIKVRDAWAFDGQVFQAQAMPWLTAANVAMADSSSELKMHRDGSAEFGTVNADMIVLADDRAIAQYLPDDELAGFAGLTHQIAIHTAPGAGTGDTVSLDLDTGASMARGPNGQVVATADDDDGGGLDRIRARLPSAMLARLAARTRFARLSTHDGAPVFGFSRRTPMLMIAGLGHLDLILAPMLARLIAGDASGIEAEWAAAHAADLRQPRVEVAEFIPGHLGGE